MVVRTPSQTIGPFFHVGLEWDRGNQVEFGAPSEKIVLTGLVYDGEGNLVSDALLETWQADSAGKTPGPNAGSKPFGYGRAGTDANGRYTIETVMPGASGEKYAPQLQVTLFARGLLKAVRTRVLLAATEDIKEDPLVKAAGIRAGTLVAKHDASQPGVWRWDIRLQGEDETVFIEV